MTARDQFLTLLKKNRAGEHFGAYSVCSSQENVIQASIAQAQAEDSFVLVESTSNQVDQNGGYTGMKPADFVTYVYSIADRMKFPRERVLLGGDHLGPNVWQNLKAEEAMTNSHVLIREYVKAGYQKIHLDASMFLADDSGDRHKPLHDEVVAGRAAALCKTAEQSWREHRPNEPAPIYIIGTEVPIPGGAKESEDHITPTAPADVLKTIEVTKAAFMKEGLPEAWERVIGVVVQPGVEFGDDQVFDYQPSQAAALSKTIEQVPNMVFEAHSTDYQIEAGLTALVRDHFCILKVGPWLTFALREALYGLNMIEQELYHNRKSEQSGLRDAVEEVMLKDPKYWSKYYIGDEATQRVKRSFSFSDRIRYYLPNAHLRQCVEKLYRNLESSQIPLSLLGQYMPDEYAAVREKRIQLTPANLVQHKIRSVLGMYSRACGLST
jgi:D-tagatose-1,6-bisphosphate aldolase subunit GatZ/KbaZ